MFIVDCGLCKPISDTSGELIHQSHTGKHRQYINTFSRHDRTILFLNETKGSCPCEKIKLIIRSVRSGHGVHVKVGHYNY